MGKTGFKRKKEVKKWINRGGAKETQATPLAPESKYRKNSCSRP